ncbi:MAG: ROK family protein [Chloroflexi bacterium]|nr:ROK family protein [Chloroflexota bacterium]
MKGDHVIGVDLGGTKILAACVDESGTIIARRKRKTLPKKKPLTGPDAVLERIVRTVWEVVEKANLSPGRVQTVAVAAPGVVNVEQGRVLRAPNLPGWEHGYDLGPKLEKRLGLPVLVENDVNLGTLGEVTYGAAKGYADVIGIFVGTGIGGGVVLGGKLRRGFRGAAGEVGHMSVAMHGPRCGCGRPGHAEALASRGAISRRLWEGVQSGESIISPAEMGPRITSSDIRRALEAGDPFTQRLIAEAQEVLAALIGSVVNLLDPECIVMGGGLVESLGETFLEPIRRMAYADFLMQEAADQVRILAAALGDDAVALGAAALALGK